MQVDTALVYGRQTSEQYLGRIGWQKRGLVMETKLYPWPVRPSSQRLPYGQGAYTEHSVLIQHPCFLLGLFASDSHFSTNRLLLTVIDTISE